MGFSNVGFGPRDGDPQPRGFLGGGEAGYNYQLGKLVLGAEGDFGGETLKEFKACAPLVSNTDNFGIDHHEFPLYNMTCNSNEDWIATLTGRAGYSWERALLYVKAGGAFSDQSYSTKCNLGPTNSFAPVGQNCASFTAAATPSPGFSTGQIQRLGWTAGLGFEYALWGNFSTKAEFDYANFGSRNVIASDGTNIKANTSVEALKIGINYRFGGS